MKPTTIITLMLAATLGLTTLSGCGIYRKYDPERIDSQTTKDYAQALRQHPDTTALGNLPWQQVFTDPVLAGLIDQALEANKDLANARLNVEIAHAQLQGARLSYLPSLSLSPNGAGASYAQSALSWTYQLPLSVSWEIDLFGRLLNSNRQAKASLLQSQAYCQAVRSQIIGGVATTYYTIAALQSQLDLSRRTAILWDQTVQTMRDFKQAGRVNEAAVVQSLAQYYSIQASITDLEASLDQAHNTLSLLLNTTPQQWQIPTDATLTTPDIQSRDIPLSQLAARPDVRAAEQSLAAAYYATASARAAFYPGLNISATGGFTNLLGGFIKNPGDWFLQLAGSLTAPIFSRGQNHARLKASKAQQQQALNNFQYTLLSATAEVNDAITVFQKATEKQQYLNSQVQALALAVDYTSELLTLSDKTTYLELLTAQQNLLGAQTSQINTRLASQRALINLYQSLGGGR